MWTFGILGGAFGGDARFLSLVLWKRCPNAITTVSAAAAVAVTIGAKSWTKQPGRFGSRSDSNAIYFTIKHANLHTRIKSLFTFRDTNESIKKLIKEILKIEKDKKFMEMVKEENI